MATEFSCGPGNVTRSRIERARTTAGLAGGLLLVAVTATLTLDAQGQFVFALCNALLFLLVSRHSGRGATLFLIFLSAATSLRYIVWRLADTLSFESTTQTVLGGGVVLAEAYALLVLALGYFQTVAPLGRKPVPLPADWTAWPAVDVFIPTYNESLDVVRASVLAALAIDWPQDRLKVWILDDGRREAFRDFAVACGAGYITRSDNKHAKAGNLNHALRQTEGAFVAIFDCDHVPNRAFLQMTMGWMLRDARIALVQTPHHFYSPDPFQRNLAAGRRVPSEGNMFYGLVQDGNDFWGAAFFCGSCALLRREALAQIGGFATETVTEDAHTALRLHRAGWESAYLRVPLAAGLATERLILHIGQRMRWARGMLQILRLDNPLLGSGLRLGQRLCYFNGMMHFMFAIPRIVFLTAPLAFLLGGQRIISAAPLAIVAYALPHIFHSVATNARIQGHWRHSFWSEIYETVLALHLVRLTAKTLLLPRRGRFNVTDKGGLLEDGYFDWRAVWPNAVLAATLAAGLGRGLAQMLLWRNDAVTFHALLLNSVWATFSLLIVLAALAVGREQRQVRTRARIRAELPVTLRMADGGTVPGVTADLSEGGARVTLGAPAAVAPAALVADAALNVELTVGPERLSLPAVAQSFDGESLQVRWTPQSIAEESRLVRAVFGRADAWLAWDDYPADRPLASLSGVLASIAGLFRRRTRPTRTAARPQAAPGAHPAQVIPPRRPAGEIATRLAARAALGALVALAGTPLLLGGQHGAAAETPDDAAVSPPAPADQAATRQVVFSLRDLGASGPMTMRGTSQLQGVVFGLAQNEVVTGAELWLSGALSAALLPDQSNVTVTLNEQYVGTIPVTPGQPEFRDLRLSVDPVLFLERNRLNFRFTGRYAGDCNDPLSGLLWASVSDRSTLHLTIARLPPARDLSRLPRPFFEAQIMRPLVLPFIVPAGADGATLKAAGIAASWFGSLAGYRGAAFPAAPDIADDGNAVVVAPLDRMPPGLDAPPRVVGPTVAVMPNPRDPTGVLLLVTGRTGDETEQAAEALAFATPALSGTSAQVSAPELPPRAPYDAPAWLPTDRPVRLGELVDPSALQGTGYVPGLFRVSFATPGDLYTWRNRPFEATVLLHAPPGPVLDVAAARADVALNGSYLRSLPLAAADGGVAAMVAQGAAALGLGPMLAGTPAAVVALPPYAVFGANELTFFMDARPLRRGACAAIPDDVKMSVDPNSVLDFRRAWHAATMPNLALFAGAGMPFSRLADLAGTAVVLPERPGSLEISAFLEVMGEIGAHTGMPAARFDVLRPSQVDPVGDRDVLMLGTLAGLEPASAVFARSPFRLGRGHLALAVPQPLDGIWRLLDDRAAVARAALGARVDTPLAGGGAALLGARLPSGRALVALVAGDAQGLVALAEALRDPARLPRFGGDATLLNGADVTAYRVGSTYSAGDLPLWLWPAWWLDGNPGAVLLLEVAGSPLLAGIVWRALRPRSHAPLPVPPRGNTRGGGSQP